MKHKKSFLNIIKTCGIISLIAIGISIITIDIILSYRDFNLRATQMRNDHIENQKKRIKREVERVVEMIKNKKALTEELTKSTIKTRTNEAVSIAQNIYEQNKNTHAKDEIEKAIFDALRPIRYENNAGYYFATRFDGVEMLFADRPEMEGKNLLNMQDTNGKYVIKDMINIARQSGEGFYEYHWTKPNSTGNQFKKISFIKKTEPFEWFIGTGLYIDDISEKIKKELLTDISKIRFGTDGYIFVNRLNGDALVSNGKLFSGEKKLWETFDKHSELLKDIFQMEYNAALKPQGDYINYYFIKITDEKNLSPKTSFIYGIPEWNWLIGAGVYLDEVEKDISLLQAELNKQIKIKLFYFVLVVLIIISFFILLFNSLNKRLKNQFNFFIASFEKAAQSDEIINRDLVEFLELDNMAKYANNMLQDKINANNALFEEKESLFVTIRSIGDGVITTDTSGKINLMNEVAEKLTGWNAEEAKGRPLSDIFNIINSKTGEKVENPVDKALKLGKIVGLANHTLLISKDGTKYQIADSAAPITDQKNNIRGVVLVFRDVTEAYRVREELKQSQQFLNSVFKSIQDGISILSPDLEIIYVNDVMKEWYKSAGPLEGKKCFCCYHGTDKPCDPCPSIRCMRSGVTEMDVVSGSPGSESKWMEVYSYPMKDDKTGEIKGIIEFVRDVTQQKQAEEELIKMQKLKSIGLLAGGIAHDFNNILMGLYGNISIAKANIEQEHSSFRFLDEAEKSMKRATHLTQQLLTFAKGGDPIIEDVDIGILVEEIVRFDLSGSNVKPVFIIEESLPFAKVDKGQIHQVFSNLTINAKQAMPQGGHLFISLKKEDIKGAKIPNLKDGTYIKLVFKDEGIGIDKNNIKQIFDPYFTTKPTGTGLGLTIVYSIINKHDGYITVESEPGKGTIFELYLPASETKNIKHKDKLNEKTTQNQHPAKILIMDDEESVCMVITEALRMLGYSAESAVNGQEATELYKKSLHIGEPFDIIVMDLTVPGGMGGKEAVIEMLKINPDAIVIVSSGYASDPVMANYSQYGFKGVIAKPYTIENLQQIITQLLKKG